MLYGKEVVVTGRVKGTGWAIGPAITKADVDSYITD
jgi:hypothetical protein